MGPHTDTTCGVMLAGIRQVDVDIRVSSEVESCSGTTQCHWYRPRHVVWFTQITTHYQSTQLVDGKSGPVADTPNCRPASVIDDDRPVGVGRRLSGGLACEYISVVCLWITV